MKKLVRIVLCGSLLLCISSVKAQGYYDITVRKQTDKIEALKNAKGSFQPLSYEEIRRAEYNSPASRALQTWCNLKSDADDYFLTGEYEIALEYYEYLLKKVYVWRSSEYNDYYKRILNTQIKLCKKKLNKQ